MLESGHHTRRSTSSAPGLSSTRRTSRHTMCCRGNSDGASWARSPRMRRCPTPSRVGAACSAARTSACKCACSRRPATRRSPTARCSPSSAGRRSGSPPRGGSACSPRAARATGRGATGGASPTPGRRSLAAAEMVPGAPEAAPAPAVGRRVPGAASPPPRPTLPAPNEPHLLARWQPEHRNGAALRHELPDPGLRRFGRPDPRPVGVVAWRAGVVRASAAGGAAAAPGVLVTVPVGTLPPRLPRRRSRSEISARSLRCRPSARSHPSSRPVCAVRGVHGSASRRGRGARIARGRPSRYRCGPARSAAGPAFRPVRDWGECVGQRRRVGVRAVTGQLAGGNAGRIARAT